MFEGFPFLYGERFSYRAYFALTYIVASFYQLFLLGCFRIASRLARSYARRQVKREQESSQRAFFESLSNDTNNDETGSGKAEAGCCNSVLRKHVKPELAVSFIVFLVALGSYLASVLLAFGHSPWTGRLVVLTLYWLVVSLLAAGAQIFNTRGDGFRSPSLSCCHWRQLVKFASRALVDFDTRYVPLLATLILGSSIVALSGLGYVRPFWACLLTYVMVAPYFYVWCRCCSCCRPRKCVHFNSPDEEKSRTHTAFSMRFFDEIEDFVRGGVSKNEDPEQLGNELIALGSLSYSTQNSNQSHVSVDQDLHSQDQALKSRSSSRASGGIDTCTNMERTNAGGDLSCRKHLNCFRSALPTIMNQIVAMCLAAVLVITCSGVCIGFFASNLPGLHVGPIIFTTSIMRALSPQTFGEGTQKRFTRCDWDGVHKRFCHMYLTLPENASNSMIVNVHTSESTKDGVQIAYCPVSDSAGDITPATCTTAVKLVSMSSLSLNWVSEASGRRAVHSAHIGPLEPDRRFAVWMLGPSSRTRPNVNPGMSQIADLHFRSLPPSGAPVNFVSGGDMGNTRQSDAVSKSAAATSPSFAIIGGDIAYANDMPECISLWDAWLSSWEALMVTPKGDAIPILSACGNHDAGSNAGSRALEDRFVDGKWVDGDDGESKPMPFMFAFFPHRKFEVANGRARRPFHVHGISEGSLEVIVLDSGHVVDYGNERQMKMLKSMPSRPDIGDGPVTCRVAVYHVPVFPSEYLDWNSGVGFMIAPRNFWLPQFERLGVSLAFENHVHTLKRTVPLLASGQPFVHHLQNPASKGATVYLGDGRWGISSGGKDPTISDNDPIPAASNTFDYDASENHVWHVAVDLAARQMNTTAIGMSGPLSGQAWRENVLC